MGQCGCGDGFGHYKLRGEGGWYVIGLYPGCQDCNTPMAVQVFFYPDGDRLLDCIADIPDATGKMRELSPTADCLFLPVFSMDDLINEPALKEVAEPSEYASVRDLASDLGYAIRQAAVTTINRTLKETNLGE